jgi:hypothetical protein
MKVGADLTGWMDELVVRQPHHPSVHAAIASIAIIVLFVLLAQLLPRQADAAGEDDPLWPL